MDQEYTEGKNFNKADFSKIPPVAGEYDSCSFKNCDFSNSDLSDIKFHGLQI